MTVPSHRKRVKHFDIHGHVHELTFSCYRRWPLLDDDEHKRQLSDAIDKAMDKQGFTLVAFVYMPEHVHLAVSPVDPDARVSSLLAAIKRPCSFRIKQRMQVENDPWLDRLMIRERPGKMTFRFWQEGPGYDRNIDNPSTLREVIQYIHANPVRRGLCIRPADWPWSSWRFYHGEAPRTTDLPTVHGWPSTLADKPPVAPGGAENAGIAGTAGIAGIAEK